MIGYLIILFLLSILFAVCLLPSKEKSLRRRSYIERQYFLQSHGYKKCPRGYEVDHIIPLCLGGADDASNMQLLSKKVHHLKTKYDVAHYKKFKQRNS